MKVSDHRKILIFDLKYSGHHREYLQHLFEFIVHHKMESRYHFMINQNLVGSFKQNTIDTTVVKNDLIKSASDAFYILKKACKSGKFERVILMELDWFRNIFIKNYGQIKLPITSILFVPPLRIKNHNSTFHKVRSCLRRCFRFYQLKWILKLNPNFTTLFILNDIEQARLLSIKWKCNLKSLPDPIKINSSISTSIDPKEKKDYYNITIIGSMEWRKNVINILKSIPLIKTDRKICITIAGKSKVEKFEKKLQNLSIQVQTNNIVVERINSFVSEKEFEEIIANSDLLSAMYLDSFGSSGILNHAIAHGKPILSSNFGLIAKMVEENFLGYTCVPDNPEAIANAIMGAIKSDFQIDINFKEKYFMKNSPENFSKKLLLSEF